MMDNEFKHSSSTVGNLSSDSDDVNVKSKREPAYKKSASLKRSQSIKLERTKRVDRKKGIIYPEDKYISYWDLWITIVLLFTCIILPIRIAFVKPLEEVHDMGTIHIWLVINTTLDLFFFIDMIIVFNSAYYDKYLKIVDDKCIIAKKYLSGWFSIDLISIIPFDIIFSELHLNGLVRVVKIGKFYKLIKITRLLRLLKILKEQKRFFKILNEYM
jgi:hypothetical protein